MKPISWILLGVVAVLVVVAILLMRKEKPAEEEAPEEIPAERSIPEDEAPQEPVEAFEATGELTPPETRMTEEYKEFVAEEQQKDSAE